MQCFFGDCMSESCLNSLVSAERGEIINNDKRQVQSGKEIIISEERRGTKNKNERDIKILEKYKAKRKLDRFKKILEIMTDIFRFVLIVVALITFCVILYYVIKHGGIFI